MKVRTYSEAQAFYEERFADIMAIREAGHREYAHDDLSTFANFEAIGSALDLDRKKVLWVYLYKHIQGIEAFLNGHESQRESVEGRLLDAINYLLLLWAMVEDEKPEDIPF